MDSDNAEQSAGTSAIVAGFDKPFGVLRKSIFVGTSRNLQNDSRICTTSNLFLVIGYFFFNGIASKEAKQLSCSSESLGLPTVSKSFGKRKVKTFCLTA